VVAKKKKSRKKSKVSVHHVPQADRAPAYATAIAEIPAPQEAANASPTIEPAAL
jgi:hypothetical protein